MSKITKQYLRDVKEFFPICTRNEQTYLKNLSKDIDDFCETNHIKSLNDLYAAYGTPSEVAYGYIANSDFSTLYKKLNWGRYFKIGILLVIVLLFIALIATCVALNIAQNVFTKQLELFSEIISIQYWRIS